MSETRTAAEVINYRPKDGDSLFGFDREALGEFLTFEEAKPWLKADAKSDWWTPKPRTREAIIEVLREYMSRIGLDKAVSHRGISASRTIEKMRAWSWLMADDEAVRICDETSYQNYGAPILKALCEHFDFDYAEMLGGPRSLAIFEAQARGEMCPSCRDGNDSGCER